MPRKLIHEHRYFLGIFSVYVVAGAISFIWYHQGREVLFFDSHHTPFMDGFFVLITMLGQGLFLSVVAIGLLFARIKYFLIYIIDLLVVGIVTGSLKHYIFEDHLRPSLFFGSGVKLHFVDGYPILTQFSFPSGHTTVAFAVFFLLAIFIRRTWVSMVLLVMALLVGISRMYLMEHFWIDVYFGSLAGMLITFFVYIALQKPLMHSENPILNFSLYQQIFKRANLEK